MSTEIELDEPFKSIWKKGYFQRRSDGRAYVDLFNSNENRSIISYARYLMSVKLGYVVPDHLEVDHKDNDRTNDAIDNLQLLTPEQNRLKEAIRAEEEKEYRGYDCVYCGISFLITYTEAKRRMKQGTVYAFCGSSCAAKYYTAIRAMKNEGGVGVSISPDVISQIKDLKAKGESSYKIAEKLGISRGSVIKYSKQ